MNIIRYFFLENPVFAYGLTSSACAALAVVPAFLPRGSLRLRALATVLCLALAGVATYAAFRAQKRETLDREAFGLAVSAMRYDYRVFILEKTNLLPPDLADFERIAPSGGGLAGLDENARQKWRADRIASDRKNSRTDREHFREIYASLYR